MGVSILYVICFLCVFTALCFCLSCHAYFFAHDLNGNEGKNSLYLPVV